MCVCVGKYIVLYVSVNIFTLYIYIINIKTFKSKSFWRFSFSLFIVKVLHNVKSGYCFQTPKIEKEHTLLSFHSEHTFKEILLWYFTKQKFI